MNRSTRSVAVLAGIISVGSLLLTPAVATATPSTGDLSFYVDAPAVQASYVDGVTQNFNDGCSTTWAGIGTTTGTCYGVSPDIFGGASTEDSAPTRGGIATPYASVWADTSMTLSLTDTASYFGLWWSAGDGPNQLEFYSDDTLISTFTFYSLVDALASPTMNGESGVEYSTADYYGNPVDGSNDGEPYAYLHAFAPVGQTFNKVVFSETGGGFEFDNVTVASSPPTADNSLVILVGPGATPSEAPGDPSLAHTGLDDSPLSVLASGAIAIGFGGLVALVVSRRRRNRA
jgi:hypothetical protein